VPTYDLNFGSALNGESEITSEFTAIVAAHAQLVDEDNEDNEPVRTSTDWAPMSIQQLFDFTSDAWAQRYSQFATLSFEDELAIYDLLLEGNADGEDDPNIGFDASTQDILVG